MAEDRSREVFDRLMNTRVAQEDRETDPNLQVGAVLIFNKGVDKEMVKLLLAQLNDHLEDRIIREFNPDWGYPVWYVYVP